MRSSAGGRASRCFAGIRFEPADQLLQIRRRERGLGNDPVRRVGQQRDRVQFLQQVVLHGEEARPKHIARPTADTKRIAILRRADDLDNSTVGAGDVFDEDRMPEGRPHMFRQQTRKHVKSTARRQRHHQGDGPRRVGLRPCRPRQRR
jgi:hypothetical protein